MGGTSTHDYFEVAPFALVAVPRPGARDDGDSARANLAFQRAHWGQRGHRGGCIVVLDRMADVSAEARSVYSRGSDPSWSLGIGLVGGTMLSRAMASFFLGISQPVVPTRMFADTESALAWMSGLWAASGGVSR